MEKTAIKVRLRRIRSSHTNLRTNEVIGECRSLPELGSRFIMTAKPLQNPKANFRLIYSTPIQAIEWSGNTVRFVTENSTYELDLLGEKYEATVAS